MLVTQVQWIEKGQYKFVRILHRSAYQAPMLFLGFIWVLHGGKIVVVSLK